MHILLHIVWQFYIVLLCSNYHLGLHLSRLPLYDVCIPVVITVMIRVNLFADYISPPIDLTY